MKRFVVLAICVFLFASCSTILDKIRPNHHIDIENNSNQQIYFSLFDSYSYSKYTNNESIDYDWAKNLLYNKLAINIEGERTIGINYYDTTLAGQHFWDRIETIKPTKDGFVIFLEVCYVNDMYAVYRGEKDIVPLWLYSYTVVDLQKYDWVLPFPDDSGTIKCEYYEYNINDYTWPNW